MLKNLENQNFMENSRGKKMFPIWYWSSRMGGFLSHEKFALRGTQKKPNSMRIQNYLTNNKNVIYWYFRKPKFAQFDGTSENESSKTRENNVSHGVYQILLGNIFHMKKKIPMGIR